MHFMGNYVSVSMNIFGMETDSEERTTGMCFWHGYGEKECFFWGGG